MVHNYIDIIPIIFNPAFWGKMSDQQFFVLFLKDALYTKIIKVNILDLKSFSFGLDLSDKSSNSCKIQRKSVWPFFRNCVVLSPFSIGF